MEKILQYMNDNKDWIFSGIGIFILSGIGCIIKKTFLPKKTQTPSIKQENYNNSSGTQIGIQNNYYRKDNDNE